MSTVVETSRLRCRDPSTALRMTFWVNCHIIALYFSFTNGYFLFKKSLTHKVWIF